MAKVEYVENTIAQIEKFSRVAFYKNGVNVKGNKENMPQYPYSMAARSDWTVAEWRKNRFLQCYPGYDVKVYMQDGTEAGGGMKLATVRGEN